VEQVKRPVTGGKDGDQTAQPVPEPETWQPEGGPSKIDYLGAEEGIATGLWFLAKSHNQELVAAGQALDKPEEGRDDTHTAATVHTTRDDQGNFHAGTRPRQMAP
jgi:hypothetical protein